MIKKLYNKKISATGLAIFRICYGLVLFSEIIQFYYFRHLIFDYIPYIVEPEIKFKFPIVIWGISVLFIIFGFFTRQATIVNYILSLLFIGSIKTFEYHMFSVYMAVNFLIIFLPISTNLSLDRLLLKFKYSNTRFNYNPPTKISVLSYYIILLVGIAFVYFDSIFFKYSSNLWINGLGVWLPSTITVNIIYPFHTILNSKYLMYFLGYLTIAFETIFIFTFFRKKWRIPLLIVGIGLHIGILITFPIPLFAIGMCTLYLLMVPVSWWKINSFIIVKEPKFLFYYDNECPLCNRTKITIQHFDVQKSIDFKTVQYDASNQVLLQNISKNDLLNNIYSIKNNKVYKGIDTYIQVFNSIFYLKPISWLLRLPIVYQIAKFIYNYIARNRDTERCTEDNCGYTPPIVPQEDDKVKILQNVTLKDLKVLFITIGLCIICFFQIVVSFNSPLIVNLREQIGLNRSKYTKKIEVLSTNLNQTTKYFFGITQHGVFIDEHFDNYNHNIAISYINNENKEIWLPITNENGTPGSYLLGAIWCKWGYRVNNSTINQQDLENGIRSFTAFWAKKNKVNLQNAKFIIKLKKMDTPKAWEKDFLQNQMNKPWVNIGVAEWNNNNYSINIPKVEEL